MFSEKFKYCVVLRLLELVPKKKFVEVTAWWRDDMPGVCFQPDLIGLRRLLKPGKE